jgi:hypothetical protein
MLEILGNKVTEHSQLIGKAQGLGNTLGILALNFFSVVVEAFGEVEGIDVL